MTKNTMIDLWNEFANVPVVINQENITVIDDPRGFMGWPAGTDVEDVWRWFDEEFAEFGGVHALMYDNLQPERKFHVQTPGGIIECAANDDGDYPGVYVRLNRSSDQIAGTKLGDLACVVEYDTKVEAFLSCIYAEDRDEPVKVVKTKPLMTFKQFCDAYGNEMFSLDLWDTNNREIDSEAVIPDETLVINWSRVGDSFEATLDFAQ